jgi:uncharacterized repeat protein (TIGR01451 family)
VSTAGTLPAFVVNGPFTIARYRTRVAMKTILAAIGRYALALLALCLSHTVAAQTLTADWTNLGRGNLQSVNDGSVLTVGPNSVTINTRVNTDGDANDANFVPYYSTSILSYYTGQVGGQTGPLLYSMDHSIFDVGDYFETTYTFATAVQSLAFTLANIDRDNGPYHHDGVVIEYDTGTGTWNNLRSLTTAYTLVGTVGTATLNGQQGFHGTGTASSLTSTNSDIRVAFGALVTVKRVRIRYMFGQQYAAQNPDGDSQYMGLSDFTWTQVGVSVSDLSLAKTVSNANPAVGATITYTLTLTNSGPQNATGVVVRDVLPSGFTFVSATPSSGSYDAVTGDWSGISINSGQTRTLTITGTVSAPAGVTITNAAEVWSSPNYDSDSTPGNGQTEDDRATVNFTVQGTRTAGTPPVLSCPAGSTLFDWDTRTWTLGSLNNSYAVTNIGTIGFAVSSAGTWTGSPTLNNSNNGGLAGTQLSLFQSLDFNTRDETATTVITLPTAVPGVQFRVFDIDFAANDFADRLTVTGSFNGSPVLPVLTNGVVNYVIGNTAIGDGASGATSGDGNVVVTFSSPVDTITIVYGNAATAPANPDGQAISIWDITFCNPVAVLGVTKVSTLISDPTNGTTNPRAIPGAVMEYCILVQNPGSGTATNVIGTDTIPAALTYTAGSISSGATCGAASTAEDDDAAGADESDPFGASVSGAVLTATAATLGPSSGFALKFRATIK